ncbi:hypothetical protein MUN88_04770 [Gracilibacillus caseinilyticus]|uniref:Uncharacterized protein n=1 Tax=Gracilibacillus caseinilyticus TaxID=2932256 RepID=A0ABY4F4M7_9BACI|nr:hypothetical protein [Gracilibacillus caseinilyticus]UOQ49421.1 hypothetical protein MUN88_04770 [Gracilibacillus caseinilyticus]
MNLAGYSYSYIDVENGTVKLEKNEHQFKDEKFINKEKKIEVNLPCTEKMEVGNGEQTIKELSDDELRRRLFDLHDLLDMKIDLYYKNAFLTEEKRKKVRNILELFFE